MFAGMMPYIEWTMLLSYPDAVRLSSTGFFMVEGSTTIHGIETVVAYLVAVFGYGLGAVVLSGAAVRAFNKAVDRPRCDTVRASKARKAAKAY